MSVYPSYLNPHGVQIGDVWQVNDSGGTFTVIEVGPNRATVTNAKGARRTILLCNLRESKANTGYTLVSRLPAGGTAPADPKEAKP